MCPHDSNSAARPPEALQWSPPQHENRVLGYHARMVPMNKTKAFEVLVHDDSASVPSGLVQRAGPPRGGGGQLQWSTPLDGPFVRPRALLCSCFLPHGFPCFARAPPRLCSIKKAIGMISSQNKYPFQYSFPPQLLTLLISGILKVSELSIRGYGPLRHLHRNPKVVCSLFRGSQMENHQIFLSRI